LWHCYFPLAPELPARNTIAATAAGNVWVANSPDFDLIEYARGGISPIATLTDYENYTFSCAVNRQNGDWRFLSPFQVVISEAPKALAPHERKIGDRPRLKVG
jgi:hypothetical protein